MHGPWAMITIITFVLGSHWGGSDGSGEFQDSAARSGGSREVDRSRPGQRSLSGSSAGRRSSSTVPAKSSRSRSQVAGEQASGSPVESGAEARSPGNGQLTEAEIQSLVRASIKSGSPVERRRAFDQLLQEMQSPGFTMEQAMTVRRAMVESGANGELLKLFDYAWGANHPDAAIAYLDEIAEQHHDGYLTNMIPGLASENPQMAIDLFSSLEPQLQARVRRRFLEGLVDNDTLVATDYLYDSTDLENYNWRPMDELARELARDQGLEPTLEWAAELPDGPLRGSAWSAAYAVWASQDPHAAVQSIMGMPEGTDRNLAINGFVSAHAHRDGERAVTWAAEISEPHLREAAMVRVGRQYYAQDPQAATQWFASSGLPQSAWAQVTNLERRQWKEPMCRFVRRRSNTN